MQEGKVSRFSPLGHYYAPPLIIVIVIVSVVIIVIKIITISAVTAWNILIKNKLFIIIFIITPPYTRVIVIVTKTFQAGPATR